MKHIVRRLLRSPMFTCVTLLTLAVGIGANTAIFSVVQGVLLKPLPYPHPDDLVSVVHSAQGLKIRDLPMSPACYFLYREQGRAFQDIGLWTGDAVNVTGLGEPEQVEALDVTDGVFGVLGVLPLLGRSFTLTDDAPASAKTAMLSYGYWQRKFGGDPKVIGRSLTVDGQPHEIIGVLRRDFHFLSRRVEIVVPLQFDRNKAKLGNFSYRSVARLKPGVTLAAASEDIARMIPILYATFPPPGGSSVKMFEDTRMAPALRPLKQDVVGNIGTLLWVLMGTIGIVLLIACANVANLLLVRAEGRQHELAVRAALGAGWARLARELMLESVTLGLAGGALGLAAAYVALRVLATMAPATLPRIDEISIDLPVVLFTAAISMLCGVVFGLIPVLKYAGPQMAGAIRVGARTLGQTRERHRARNTLVVVQVALALVLLVGGGLMIRTFQALRSVQPGFTNPQEVLTLTISIPGGQVEEDEMVVRTQQAILDKISSLAGVRSAAFANRVPMDDNSSFDSLYAEDDPVTTRRLALPRQMKFTSPGFFETMGNPVLAGRDYRWDDIYGRRRVAIVTENLAREYWGSAAGAIGKRVRENLDSPWREVVGVVGVERDKGVDQPAPTTVYWPAIAADLWGRKAYVRRTVTYVIRSHRTGSEGFVNDIRQAVWSVNSNLPVAGVQTMKEIYDRSMTRTSFALVMLVVAGAMALLLGVIGIYGVIAYSVSQRTREIGIRMALGAQRQALTQMFVGHGLKLVAIGVLCGLAAAWALARGMSSLLFGVSAADPLTYAGVCAALAAAAAVASYVPARRATAVDPVDALRAD